MTIMSGLMELERIEHYEECAQRCLSHAQTYPGTAGNDLLLLRSVAYRERTQGYDAVALAYEAAIAGNPDTPVADQASKLVWFHEAPTNALLGAHINARYRVYLDGRFVGQGDSATDLSVWKVALAPGEHELAVEAAPVRRDAWITVYLRMHGTNLVSDGSWEYSKRKPANWPATDDPAIEWLPPENPDGRLPKMPYWHFTPNAFVDMQKGRVMRPWDAWDIRVGTTVAYVRKKFTVPARLK